MFVILANDVIVPHSALLDLGNMGVRASMSVVSHSFLLH